jgi:hypothetical protein
VFAFIGSLVQSVIGGVLSPIFTYLNKKQDVNLEQFRVASDQERADYLAYVQALGDANKVKVAANNWSGAHFMIYAFGVPPALHWGAVFIASTFTSLGWVIPALPAAYASAEQTIALSFFILAPTLPLVSSAANMLNKRN